METTDIAVLERRIQSRERFLQKIVPLVQELLHQVGKELTRSVHSCHIHSQWELRGFFDFDFSGDFGQSSHGGNDIKIFFKRGAVLCVYWQVAGFEAKDCSVRVFEENTDWQLALKKIGQNKKSYITRFLGAKQKASKAVTKEAASVIRAKAIKDRAARLRISV